VKAIAAIISILCMNISFANDVYIVKKGDTLSTILQAQQYDKFIYGKNGSLLETLSMNPDIRRNKGNKIFPNMKIFLKRKTIPPQIVSQEPAFEQVSATPSNAIDRKPSDSLKQSFQWEIIPSVSWKNLSSIDENIYRSSKITATSNTNFGVSVSYGMRFEEMLKIYSKFSCESVSFARDGSINLLSSKFFAGRYNVGLNYQDNWNFELAMSDNFYLTSPNTTSVDIKKVTLPEVKVSYMKNLTSFRNAKFSFSVSGSAFLPKSSPDVKSKLGYGGGGALEAKLNNQSFKVGHELNFLKASGNSTNYQNIYWNYVWESF
jgi:hypothetical protein